MIEIPESVKKIHEAQAPSITVLLLLLLIIIFVVVAVVRKNVLDKTM